MGIQFKTEITQYAVGRRANSETWNSVTRTNSGASAIGFGVPVMPGSGTHDCIELDATNGRNVLGITEASQVLGHTGDTFAQYDNVPVCEAGVIGVLLGKNVARGAAARWDTAGKAWTDAAQSVTVVTIPGAQFEEAGASGSVGVVRYRRPVPSVSISG